MSEVKMNVQLGPLTLKNPVLSASGTFGYGIELKNFCPPEALGAVITKGISQEPWPGNETPRMAESASGLINAIGLENMGVKAFTQKALPTLKKTGATVGANILGHSLNEYAAIAGDLASTDVDFLEVNVSCPNVAAGGLSFGADPQFVAEITSAVRENCPAKPIVVKLTPQVANIVPVAQAAETAGATAVSLINTLPALAIDLKSRRPKLANVVGGLSGPAIKPVALRLVWQAASALKIPVIGLGGIMTAEDALEFIVAGATAVQIGTASLIDPRTPLNIIDGLQRWMCREGLENFDQIRGTLKI